MSSPDSAGHDFSAEQLAGFELAANTGAPTWRSRAHEAVFEAAVQFSCAEEGILTESGLYQAAGRSRNARDFRKLLKTGMLEYTDGLPIGAHQGRGHGGGRGAAVELTPHGIDYGLHTIGERVDQLIVVRDSLAWLRQQQQG